MKMLSNACFPTVVKSLIAGAAVLLVFPGFRAADAPPPAKRAAAAVAKPDSAGKADKVNILWTSRDKDVALKMVFMYALNAKKQGWWKEVEIIIWGPSSQLTANDKDVQDYLKRMQDAGVVVRACRACADEYGVTKKLEGLGIEVKYMGKALTEILKRDGKLMIF